MDIFHINVWSFLIIGNIEQMFTRMAVVHKYCCNEVTSVFIEYFTTALNVAQTITIKVRNDPFCNDFNLVETVIKNNSKQLVLIHVLNLLCFKRSVRLTSNIPRGCGAACNNRYHSCWLRGHQAY